MVFQAHSTYVLELDFFFSHTEIIHESRNFFWGTANMPDQNTFGSVSIAYGV